MNSEGRAWRVGELATATGLSVRALHHYDEIGLLQPVRRTGAGHRLYDEVDVRRLHRILALRGFGLSLGEVGRVLDGELGDPRALVRRQLEQVEQQLIAAERLRADLRGVLSGLEQEQEPSADKLIELMEGMTAMTRVFTAEEITELTERRREAMAAMSEGELADLQQTRERWRASLSDQELAELTARRQALMPKE
ncbi:MAG: MerR family transcriptional regulator, thiopeptide resistance regulator [Kribbellaceae bacterium]|jgi:DNA-binding transcriptional MerR regulator|nr:MerR family transcriptional regulator, thiopeptide resistance regulator [Kribbellaceae bacterium]